MIYSLRYGVDRTLECYEISNENIIKDGYGNTVSMIKLNSETSIASVIMNSEYENILVLGLKNGDIILLDARSGRLKKKITDFKSRVVYIFERQKEIMILLASGEKILFLKDKFFF